MPRGASTRIRPSSLKPDGDELGDRLSSPGTASQDAATETRVLPGPTGPLISTAIAMPAEARPRKASCDADGLRDSVTLVCPVVARSDDDGTDGLRRQGNGLPLLVPDRPDPGWAGTTQGDEPDIAGIAEAEFGGPPPQSAAPRSRSPDRF